MRLRIAALGVLHSLQHHTLLSPGLPPGEPHLVLEGEHAGGAGQGGAAVGDPGDRDPGVQPEGV